MKTKLSHNNPFTFNRYGFLWEQLSKNEPGIHLDYGAYNGFVLSMLSKSQVIHRGEGVDLNREIVESSQSSLPENIQLQLITKGKALPFSDKSFDSISILDVIEHVYDQDAILGELYRVLKPGGLLIVTAPKHNILSFLDTGNIKFRFPTLHKWYYQYRYSKMDYTSRYLNNPNGLIGDIEKEKMWHEHFSNDSLETLLIKNGFTDIKFDGSAFLQRALSIVTALLPPLKPLMEKLTSVDAKMFAQSNIFSVSQKR